VGAVVAITEAMAAMAADVAAEAAVDVVANSFG